MKRAIFPTVSKNILLTAFLEHKHTGQCQYELTLLDSYGDWNGNSINVQVAGFAPSNLTLNGGSSIRTIGIGLGETISFSWQGGGPFQDECSYTVKDLFTGTVIYASPWVTKCRPQRHNSPRSVLQQEPHLVYFPAHI